MARDRPGGEPPAIGYALSHDGSKAIVLQRQDRRRFHDVLDTGTGESRRLLSRSFVDMRWGEDSDTAYATAAGGGWRAVFRYTARYTELEIIGGVQADGTVWALSNRGRDSVALVRLDIATGAEEPVYRRRRFDVDRASVLFDDSGEGTPLLTVHHPGYQEVVHFDARLESAYAALRARLGGKLRIDLESADRALKYAAVEARSPEIHRRLYLLDLEAGTSRELSAATLAGYDRPAEPSRPVRFAATRAHVAGRIAAFLDAHLPVAPR